MVCEICGSENFKVISNPKRGENCDIRHLQCCDCKAVFLSVTECPYIILSGKTVTIKDARSLGVIKELQENYIKNKMRRFKGGADGSINLF